MVLGKKFAEGGGGHVRVPCGQAARILHCDQRLYTHDDGGGYRALGKMSTLLFLIYQCSESAMAVAFRHLSVFEDGVYLSRAVVCVESCMDGEA